MKTKFFLLLVACCVAASPLYAEKTAAPGAPAAAEDQIAKTGVRFVACSTDGSTLPSPLYYEVSKGKYKSVSIGGRKPSPRIRPQGGVVKFYKEDPGAAAAAAAADKTGAAKMPEPALSFEVPGGGKMLGIIIPTKEGKPQTLYVEEKAFPKSGMHIINLSSFPLVMTTAKSADFTDKKESKIGVFHRDNPVSAENSWTYKGEADEVVSFILSYVPKDAAKPKQFRASKFQLAGDKAQINLVVKDAVREAPKLISIDLTDK